MSYLPLECRRLIWRIRAFFAALRRHPLNPRRARSFYRGATGSTKP